MGLYAASGLAAGHYMAKKQPACVYLQNSGLGNTVTHVTPSKPCLVPAYLIAPKIETLGPRR